MKSQISLDESIVFGVLSLSSALGLTAIMWFFSPAKLESWPLLFGELAIGLISGAFVGLLIKTFKFSNQLAFFGFVLVLINIFLFQLSIVLSWFNLGLCLLIWVVFMILKITRISS